MAAVLEAEVVGLLRKPFDLDEPVGAARSALAVRPASVEPTTSSTA